MKKNNELIKRRKRKQRYRRGILLLFILSIITAVLLLKLPYFNINQIQVNNNKKLNKQEVITVSKLKIGENIFISNLNKIKNNLLTNPYISSVTVKRKLPSTVVINIQERTPYFFIQKDKDIILMDSDGYALEKTTAVPDNKLIRVDGIDINSVKVGENLKDSTKLNILHEFTKYENKTDTVITSIDVSLAADIKVNFKDSVLVKIGTVDNLRKKLSDAVDIINQTELKTKKGYIDMSYNGSPVYAVDNP
ncbi:FtsQ-type POTRA domain-containing protein [Clostridium sp. 19966]|uniref:cell division protein FtsQ/DivIB n=1 Tax=Clostridium sp. 19966 TaxID=2768166 RepID=UPI0028DDE8D4|nr:FtsQ-type POTRA domain-containing protein [Clostridium sp. 19966]MDT8716619.1 FtsQ-type POTRA domain-containing protein [Clostridium sp. 19966]